EAVEMVLDSAHALMNQGIGCLLMCIVPAIFCRTQPVDPSKLERISLENIGRNFSSLVGGFGTTFRCKPFLQICIATFFVFNAFNTVAGFSWFIIVYYMNGGDPGAAGTWPAWFGTVSALATCFLAIPTVTMLSQWLGKKGAFLLSQCISIVGYVSFWWCFNPETPWLLFLPLPLFAFGIGSLFTIMMSMTADVCDLDELNTGARREGVFGAVYWWMVKFGFAIAALGGGVIMKLVGFDESVAQQTPEALTGLRFAYILVPVTGTILAMLIMLRYDLDEERSAEIRQLIAERKGEEGA
ncbi:MAG: MFS transporter, partial [Planctomycetota bacterium]